METVILGIGWYIVFLLSSTVHEAAHALAALKLGDRTAYHGGQVSIDPRPHIRQQPFGMIVVPILTFFLSGWMMGWASVPYDPLWAQRYPNRSAVMSLAGPAANLSLVMIAGILIRVGMLLGWFHAPDLINFTHVTAVTPDMPSFFNGLAT
ncbi:MAG: hypothetical protein E4H27_09290, partial [Anaerolineales bacterium]